MKHRKERVIGLFDPKMLRINGVEYHLPKKGTPEPVRIGNAAINKILGKTGIQAAITYWHHSVEQGAKIWKEQVRDRLEKWGLIEKRS